MSPLADKFSFVWSRTKTTLLFAVITGLGSALWSCGYRSVRSADDNDAGPVHVPLVRNLTSHADLTGSLTSAIRRCLARKGVEVVGARAGALRLEVTIVQVRSKPGMLGLRDSRLVSVDNIWEIQVDARLRKSTGETAAGPEIIQVTRRVFQGGNALAEETLGRRKQQALLDEIAHEIAYRFFGR